LGGAGEKMAQNFVSVYEQNAKAHQVLIIDTLTATYINTSKGEKLFELGGFALQDAKKVVQTTLVTVH